jgi:glycosyltransferase involved in cell wall biosynthesis
MSKVLFVDNNVIYLRENINYTTGGASVQTLVWAKAFSELGLDWYYTSDKKTNDAEAVFVKDLNSSPKFLFWMLYTYRINKIVKKLDPSILYLSTAGWKTIIWGIIARINKMHYIQRISNDIVFDRKLYRKKLGTYKYFLAKVGVKMSDLIACQNKSQFQILSSVFRNKNIQIIHNPYLHTGKVDMKNERKYVAWIGIFQYQKNLARLLEVAEKLPDVNFRIAGKSGDYFLDDETKEALEKLKTMPNVEFVGFLNRDKVIHFLGEAYCLLNTSRYEGFSNTYLESLAAGTPIVTRIKTDPDEIIRKYDLGVSCENYNELAGAVNKVVMDKNINRDKLINYVKEKHHPLVLAEKLLRYLN